MARFSTALRLHIVRKVMVISIVSLFALQSSTFLRPSTQLGHVSRHLLSSDPPAGGENYTCADVVDLPEACELVSLYCGHGDSFFDYFSFHFCALHDIPALSIFVQVLWLSYLFISLGVAAESFFCPSLNVISDDLKLSENVAGVTLLALGNGAPDMFSTFSAAVQGSFELAFGEVIGAGVFITTVVVGGVAILSPFTVTRRPFIRDVLFYVVSLVFVYVVLYDGNLYLWETLFLCGWYILYVIVVIVGRRIYQRMKAAKMAKEEATTEPLLTDEDRVAIHGPSINAEYDDTPTSPNVPTLVFSGGDDGESIQTTSPAVSLHSTQELVPPKRQPRETRSLISDATQQPSYDGRSRALSDPTREGARLPRTKNELQVPINFSDEVRPWRVKSITTAFEYATSGIDPERRSITSSPRSRSSSGHHSFVGPRGPLEEEPHFAEQHPFKHMFAVIFPVTVEFKERSIAGKIAGIINTPIYFFLALTVPVLDKEISQEAQWNRYLTTLQFFMAPFFLTLGLGVWDSPVGSEKFPVYALCIILGFVFAVALFFATSSKPPKYYNLIAWPSFVISIMWIYIIANELVALISTLGAIFKISETLLGLTVLAWGNSVGDLIANLAVARMGYSGMAVAASYAGPMLNMLLGVGISCAYIIIAEGKPYPVEMNRHFMVSLLTLLIVLGLTLIIIPFSKFRFTRYYGAFLIVSFIVSTALNVAVAFI